MMVRRFVSLSAILGFLGVAIGAFGAHGLQSTLSANGTLDTFQTASHYHLVHALALLGVAWAAERYPGRLTTAAGLLLGAAAWRSEQR
jgi:uncharacterized membrane protein YgdD (TMEM256/DUF423 family)